MAETSSTLVPFVAKLERHCALGDADRSAVLALPHKLRAAKPGDFLFRAGEPADSCCVIHSGLVCRSKVVASGRRQIVSVHMRGDGVDIQNALLSRADHDIQALTSVEAAFIPASAVSKLISNHPSVGRAMWIETLADASIHREWTVNVGARDARTRIAHLLCELGVLMETAGLANRARYELVLTQEQLADATGLTPVHVNRSLQHLAADGLIQRNRRIVEIGDWQELAAAGDFQSEYLHLTAN